MKPKALVRKLEKALDTLIDVESECHKMGKGNTCGEAINRIRSLISTTEDLDDYDKA